MPDSTPDRTPAAIEGFLTAINGTTTPMDTLPLLSLVAESLGCRIVAADERTVADPDGLLPEGDLRVSFTRDDQGSTLWALIEATL